MNNLKKYQEKRDFTKTGEPKGKIYKHSSEKIFVVQHHYSKKEHYDFRLDYNGYLLSWAVPKGPSLNPYDKRLAVMTENHPYEYKDFEGEIPSGEYGAGKVEIYDNGTYKELKSFKSGLKQGMLKFELNGKLLKGKFALIKMDDKNWLLIKEKDQFCVTNKKTKQPIKKVSSYQNPFHEYQVELALLNEDLPKEKGWIYEIKYDGYRITALIENNKVQLFSRNNQNLTLKFKAIEKALEKFSTNRAMILDGEIVKFDNQGRSDFQALQTAIKKQESEKLTYVIFDILSLDGKDLRNLPLIKRKEILKSLFKNKPSNLLYSTHIETNAKTFYNKAKELSLEGIIAKKKDSVYLGKRSGNWIKLKFRKSDDFIIGGYLYSNKVNGTIKSLLLGRYEDNKLHYCGKVGTGFNKDNSDDLIKKFKSLTRQKNPFCDFSKTNEKIIFLKPILIGEIEFAEYTAEGLLRQASFKGLRTDIDLSEKNQSLSNSVTLSNPNRILYPKLKITKQDVYDYYQKVGSLMLNYLSLRPLSVLRCHDTIENSFIKRHPATKENIKTFFTMTNGQKQEYFYVDSLMGILQEVQNGSVEFHIWGTSVTQLSTPNYLVFDLDPDLNMDLSLVRQGVKNLKKLLDELHLRSFLKTSGGKGYHVVVPFSKVKSWQKLATFSKDIALTLEKRYPDLFTTNIRKDARKGKIFVDWLRNKKGATSIAPYSLRAREKASISWPITWNKLDMIAPSEITITNYQKYLKTNPWRDFQKAAMKQSL